MIDNLHQDDWEDYAQQGRALAEWLFPRHLHSAKQFVRQHAHQPLIIKKRLEDILHLLSRAHRYPTSYSEVMELVELLDTLPYRLGYWREWEHILIFTIHICDELKLPQTKINFLGQLSELMFAKGAMERAQEWAEIGLRLARQLNNPALWVKFEQVVIAGLLEVGEWDAANDLFSKLNQKFGLKEMQLPEIRGRLSYLHALLVWYKGDLREAVSHFTHAIALLPVDSPAELGHAYRLRGLSHWQLAYYAEAVSDFKQASRIFAQVNNIYDMWWALGNLGLVYWSMGRLLPAERLTQKSLAVFGDFDSAWQIAGQLGNLSVIALSRGYLEKALSITQEHITATEKLRFPVQLSRAQSNQAIVYMHLGEIDKALPILKRNFELGEKMQRRTPSVGTLYVNLSRCYRLVGQTEEGLHRAQQALVLGEETQSRSLILISLRCLAEFQDQDSIALLQQALSIAQSTERQMDEAACWLGLGHLQNDAELCVKGTHLLERCGSAAWLDGCSRSKPPMLPLMM